MSADDLGREERAALAAELALGLLEGADRDEARRLAAADADFRADVDRWKARFASLLDGVEERQPPASAWPRILAVIGSRTAANDNAGELRRSLARWRLASGGFGAVAAALALVLITRPDAAPLPPAPAPIEASAPMVAMIAGDDGPAPVRLVANWDPTARRLIVTPAMKPAMDSDQSIELWVIPADGTPRSMGVLPAFGPMRETIDAPMGRLLDSGATLAISIERSGGSPSGAPEGPVVATGKLETT